MPKRIDLNADADALGTDPLCAGVELDDIAEEYRRDEVHPLHRRGYPDAMSVTQRSNHRGLIHIAQDHATENRPIRIGIPRHRDHAKCKRTVIRRSAGHSTRVVNQRRTRGGLSGLTGRVRLGTMTTQNSQPTSSQTTVAAPCLDLFDSLGPHEIVERYRVGLTALDPRVLDMSDEQADRWFAADSGVGLWSCRALLTHLMDAEILYAMRFRRTLAEDNPVFENWDEDAFMDSRLCRPGSQSLLMPTGAVVATLHTLRQTLATVLVQMTPEDWERKAMSPYLGEASFLTMLRYISWHFEHHAAFLNGKVNSVLGPAADAAEQQSGCGEGCSCVGGNDDAASENQTA